MMPSDERKLINRYDKRNNILTGPDIKTEMLAGDKKVRFKESTLKDG